MTSLDIDVCPGRDRAVRRPPPCPPAQSSVRSRDAGEPCFRLSDVVGDDGPSDLAVRIFAKKEFITRAPLGGGRRETVTDPQRRERRERYDRPRHG